RACRCLLCSDRRRVRSPAPRSSQQIGGSMRALMAAIVASVMLSVGGSAGALAEDSYPSRTIRLVVPYGAGGASDVMARQLGRKLGDMLGQPVVIENQPAAAGTVAYTTVARAAP